MRFGDTLIDKTVGSISAGRSGIVRDWAAAYASRLMITDFMVLVWVVFGVQTAWFGFDQANAGFRGNLGDDAVSYSLISVIVIVAWMSALGIYGSRDSRTIGVGSTEYRRILDASIRIFGLIAIAAFLFKVDLARGYVLIAFPLGTLVLMLSRWMWRQWLGVQRMNGRYSDQVVLVGSEVSARHIARELLRLPGAGYHVVGACIPGGAPGETLGDTGIPIVGTVATVTEALGTTGADTVVITSSDELSPERVRQLSWNLEPGRQHLVVAPSLTDIGGPRIHTRPVAGLPLIHVETPRYEGPKLVTKRTFDVLVSAVLIALFSPVLVVIAVIVRATSPGPVLFRQKRVGLNGKRFDMLKFRSMVVNADEKLAELQAQQRAEGNSVMFKMKNDPRVTPAGRVLRRFSLDELPQLFNVFAGTMSLVGPRPPLERELGLYEEHVHRRFLVKPGITGLWQVSGRSNLNWEDTVRLDLYYVENWSMAGDIGILWRTAKAVVGSDGAY
jgi:exopolysaccharide biosynthesis polyprenyl glycosylphosphotransferase